MQFHFVTRQQSEPTGYGDIFADFDPYASSPVEPTPSSPINDPSFEPVAPTVITKTKLLERQQDLTYLQAQKRADIRLEKSTKDLYKKNAKNFCQNPSNFWKSRRRVNYPKRIPQILAIAIFIGFFIWGCMPLFDMPLGDWMTDFNTNLNIIGDTILQECLLIWIGGVILAIIGYFLFFFIFGFRHCVDFRIGEEERIDSARRGRNLEKRERSTALELEL